jgi:hypothetical protein
MVKRKHLHVAAVLRAARSYWPHPRHNRTNQSVLEAGFTRLIRLRVRTRLWRSR